MRRFTPVFVLCSLVVLVQLLTALTQSSYYLTQLTMTAYYTIVILGLTLLLGYAGQISIGHAGFFALGGYTSAVLTTLDLASVLDKPVFALLQGLGATAQSTSLYGETIVHIAPWAALLAALCISGVVALGMGIPILRLKGHYLAMATLGLGTIIYRIVLGTGFCGEADGISGVPGFPLGAGISVSGERGLRLHNYYLAWILVILTTVLLINLIRSRPGRALRAIHGNEEAAAALGVPVARYKVSLFVISAVMAAGAGSFLTHFNGGIGPSEASVIKSVRYVAIVAIGGMNLWGALCMSVVLHFISLRGYLGSYDDAFFGLILVVLMLISPESAASFFSSLREELVDRWQSLWMVLRGRGGSHNADT